MDKIVIYGLGKSFDSYRKWLESNYEVVGYSDKKISNVGGYITPNELINTEFDFIIVTSTKYYEDIKEELVNNYNISENKIVSAKVIPGYVENYEKRRKWIIKKLSEIPSGKVLLDAGAGECQYKPYCGHLKYIAQDFGGYESGKVDSGLVSDKWDTSECDIVCDIIDMPLDDESVDVILCSEVFEHLKNPVLAIKEFSRVLKKGGQLILTAPFCSLTHMAPYYYSNGFSEFWYKEHLKDYGFEITEMTRYGNYFDYLCQELLRVPEMAGKYCNVELKQEDCWTMTKILKMLSELSSKDVKSNELLCFGYMITATLG
jgi:predicted SAM-dependent methyltransferase